MRRLAFAYWSIPLGVALIALGVACGADDAVAPPAKTANLSQCQGFEQLMPNFMAALRSGKTENLKTVIQDHLLVADRPGDPPPINDVLRALFTTLNAFARAPAEIGAPEGELCAVTPPPLAQANQLCEMRRALDLLVHQGKGLAALHLLEPLINDVLNYIIGRGKDGTPHYEVAAVLAGNCAQDGVCQLSDGLDLLLALSQFLESSEGKALQNQLNGLLDADGGSLLGLLNPQSLTEQDFVSLYNVLLSALYSADPQQLDDLLNNPLLASYKTSLQPVVDAAKPLLDPNHNPDLIDPLRKVLNCVQHKDPNSEVARMAYRLFLRDDLDLAHRPDRRAQRPAGRRPARLADSPAGTIAYAVRSDEQAIDSTANVCRTLLSTKPMIRPSTKSNAQLALPVVDRPGGRGGDRRGHLRDRHAGVRLLGRRPAGLHEVEPSEAVREPQPADHVVPIIADERQRAAELDAHLLHREPQREAGSEVRARRVEPAREDERHTQPVERQPLRAGRQHATAAGQRAARAEAEAHVGAEIGVYLEPALGQPARVVPHLEAERPRAGRAEDGGQQQPHRRRAGEVAGAVEAPRRRRR